MKKSRIDAYSAQTRYLNGQSVRSIAQDFGVSRVSVWKAWKRIGFSTYGFRIKRECSACGKQLLRRRQRALNSIRSFCSQDCYIRWVHEQGEGYMPWRQGQRRAKKSIAPHFLVLPGMVIHHVDKNSRHNEIGNLWVFASQSDHMRFHRGGKVMPIWRGDPA